MAHDLVADYMTTDVLTFNTGDAVPDAVARLVERGVDAAPVVDDEGKVVGMLSATDVMIQDATLHLPTIITLFGATAELPIGAARFDRDIHLALASTVGELMTPDPVTIADDASMGDVATMLHYRDVGRLPVLDASGALVGIVARGDVLRYLISGGETPDEVG